MWVKLKDFPTYEINKKGIVRNIKTKRIKKTFSRIGAEKYKAVLLYKDRKYHGRYIHRLLCITFILNPNNYPCVNHIDGDPRNNSLKNLEWCTHKMNTQHAKRLKLLDPPTCERAHSSKLSRKKVRYIKMLLKDGYKQKDIAKIYNVNQSTISDIKNNITWRF